MAAPQLDAGAIEAMVTETVNAGTYQPVLQIVDCRRITSKTGTATDRYRVVVSDGVRFTQCMAASQLNGLVNSGELTTGCFVRMDKYLINKIQNNNIIILLDLAVVAAAQAIVGSPTGYPKGEPLPNSAGV